MTSPESIQLRHQAGEVRTPKRVEEGESLPGGGHLGRLPGGGSRQGRWSGCHSGMCRAMEGGGAPDIQGWSVSIRWKGTPASPREQGQRRSLKCQAGPLSLVSAQRAWRGRDPQMGASQGVRAPSRQHKGPE